MISLLTFIIIILKIIIRVCVVHVYIKKKDYTSKQREEKSEKREKILKYNKGIDT